MSRFGELPCSVDEAPRGRVERFEQFVAVAMEAEGLIVSEAAKFPVRRKAGKVVHDEAQIHGYEVDLIGARAGRLVLARVNSLLRVPGVRR